MDDKRKLYRREWMAKKRAKIHLNRENELLRVLNSESEEDLPAPVIHKLCDAFNGEQKTMEAQCSCETDCSSTDFATKKTWDFLDKLCDDYSSSSYSDSNEKIDSFDLQSDLRAWVIDCNVTPAQLNKLLPISVRA